jgi:adenylate kinase
MRLILLGPPGSGKGTQATLLCTRNGLEHIGTGDIIRAAIKNGTPAGRQAKSLVEAGQLVPDEIVNALVAERFERDDRPQRFVMDGYPRTLNQAQTFDQILGRYNLPLTRVVLIDVPDEEIIGRVAHRWSCPKPGCKATYHDINQPPRVPGICDNDGTPLIKRDDDKAETVRRRLLVYHADTVALIPYYQKQGLLVEVPGTGGIEEVYQSIMEVLAEPVK